VAGVISPLVMHSTLLLALASLLMSCVGIVSWIFVRKTVLPAG
jgi:MFS transporter, DHA1 family, multidrug resistance protein